MKGERCLPLTEISDVCAPDTLFASNSTPQSVPRARLEGGFLPNLNSNNRSYGNTRNNYRGMNFNSNNNNNNNSNSANLTQSAPRTLTCLNCGGGGHLQNVCQQPPNASNIVTNNMTAGNRPIRERPPTDRYGYNNNCILAEGTDGAEIIGFSTLPTFHPKTDGGVLSYPIDDDMES